MGEPNRLDSLGPPGEVKNKDHFSYAEETKLAWEEGKLSKDIMEEQRKLTQADLVIFQVPLFSPSCDYSSCKLLPSGQNIVHISASMSEVVGLSSV